MILAPHQQRVLEEKQELDVRLSKLDAFLQSNRGAQLPADERERMVRQWHYMHGYSQVLGERIAAFPQVQP